MQAALATLVLLAVWPRAAVATGFDITEGEEVTVNAEGTSNVATVMLSATDGIACYLDFGNNVNDGWCNAIDLSSSDPSVVDSLRISEKKPQYFTLDRFSDSQAVMCYSSLGGDGELFCNVLQLSGRTLTKGPDLDVDPDAVYFHTFAVASFTETSGVVCYADPTNSEPALQVKCVPIEVNTGDRTLTKGAQVEVLGSLELFRKAHHVDRVAVTAFSPTTAVVCAQLEEGYVGPTRNDCPKGSECIPYGAFCHVLGLESSALSVGVYSIVTPNAAFNTAVTSLDSTTGILCYADGSGNVKRGRCLPLSVGNQTVTLIEESALEVNSADTTNITVVGMSDTAAMVCYLDGAQANVGTCNGLVLSHGTDLQMGDDKVVVDGDLQGAEQCRWEKCGNFMASSAVLSPLNMDGLVCYAGLGGDIGLRCRMLAVPPPTTTTTGTTGTETSSTTPHTTSETSSTTMTTTATTFTRTTKTTTKTTTTTETSTTSPHTTTETTTTEAPESNAGVRSMASVGAIASLVLGACVA